MTTYAPTPDLFKAWKDAYDQFEKTWTKPMHELISTESFAASMGVTRDSYLTSQKTMREGMEQYLKSLHMPSKTDVSNLATLVVNLESKVERLEDRLDDLEEQLGRHEGRFDRLETKLDAIHEALIKLASAPVVEFVVPSADEAAAAAAAQAAPAQKRRASK